jgi:hypothetical protein
MRSALALPTAILLAHLGHAQTGSDSCATPDAIAGAGQFAFDNLAATTGAEGQQTPNCMFYAQNGILSDVWFVWTAPQNGRVLLSACGQTAVDTKIAVYSGAGCPALGALAAGCNDDITSSGPQNLASFLEFDTTAGEQFMVQIGTYPLATSGGNGSFTITYVGGVQCVHDDGSTDYASQVGAGPAPHTTCWMYRLGEVGTATIVSTVSTVWGWTNTGTPLVGPLTGNVGVWEDPNDDGHPSDAVLLGTASAPVVGAHTDVFQSIPLPAPVTLQGTFFVAAWVETTIGFPTPRDIHGCNGRPGVGWLAGNAGAPFDAVNLFANSSPPVQAPNGQTYFFLLRADCMPAGTGNVYCIGDSVAPHTACPCGNSSASGDQVGCLNSFGVGGRLRAQGIPSLGADSVALTADQLPASSVLFFQGTVQQNGGNGAAFGDGLRCAGGAIVRLRTYTATGAPGAASTSFPQGADPSLSVRGGVTAPGTRTYQAWYRNPAGFCTPSVFNLSNGLELNWLP